MKFKCIRTFTIEDKRRGTFRINKGEVWEVKDEIDILLVRDGVGIKLLPWQLECFEEITE